VADAMARAKLEAARRQPGTPPGNPWASPEG
jgi:hypothetical protein